jgi:Uncharacterized protein predicted to be involved in DNA repair (RAMP superfamily)
MASDRSEAKGREGGGAMKSFEKYPHVGFALDPIHVGTGGARLGRADLSIVRDPVMRVPKIPGSSLAGVYRAYVAMTKENKYPDCAGLGHPREDGKGGHCGSPNVLFVPFSALPVTKGVVLRGWRHSVMRTCCFSLSQPVKGRCGLHRPSSFALPGFPNQRE